MLRIQRYSEVTTHVLYVDVPTVVRGCIASGGMPEVNTSELYQQQLYNLLRTLENCNVYVVYENDLAVAFCGTYTVDADPHCAGKGLVCSVTMSSQQFPRAIPMLLKSIKRYAVLHSYDWWYTSKKIDEYTYQGKYNLLRRDHG